MITVFVAILFWISAALIFYSYFAYPLLVLCFSRLCGRERSVSEEGNYSVSLLIAAHNEEAVMEQRIENALALDYPREKLEIVIASDGSSDGTAAIVRKYADRGVRLIEFPQRRGKAATLNSAIPQLRGEIILLSDANTDLQPSAVRKLVRWFGDPQVGVVCGRLILADARGGRNADSLYWKYETMLKRCESQLGSLLGANGAIYAIRRSVFKPIPDGTIIDDFVIPLVARLRSGCSIVYDMEAVAREETPPDVREEFRRRCRIGTGNIQSIGLLWPLLNPQRGFVALSFFSHKLLRWFCPFFLIGLLASSIALAGYPFYRAALLAQVGFYLFAIVVMLAPRSINLPKPVRLAAMFVSMNAALLVGFFRWLNSPQGVWEPTARPDQTKRPPPKNRFIDARGLRHWLMPYILDSGRRRDPQSNETVHLILCVADHFEPQHGGASPAKASARVEQWTEKYPRLFGDFHDSDGRTPQHSFFYPMEMYEPDHLDELAKLCRSGHGEVEVHLHHDDDTAEALRERLLGFKQLLFSRHGLLSRRRDDGQIVYGFIHGDWALDNSHPSGRHCGVNNELDILRETGCYADFTFPSAPSPTQPKKINSIYYACDDPARPRSHDRGPDVGTMPRPEQSLMLIQGPLLLNSHNRKWGIVPRIENACIQATQLPSERRLDLWLRARIQVPTRPDWFFVKLHTHGAAERNMPMLLGEPMARFHEVLARRAEPNRNFHYHYVTAREMYNLVRAAEAGWTGTIEQARDFELVAATSLHPQPAVL